MTSRAGAAHDLEMRLHSLMLRGLDGDGAAHRELLETLCTRFRAFFRNRLPAGEDATAEDLVQEAILAVHMKRETFDRRQPVTAWAYAIARYKLIDHFRRARIAGAPVPVDSVDDLFAAETADAADPARDVAALLAHLPAKQRAAIQLVKLEELSVRDAAARTGMSESDVRVSIHRGIKRLSALVAKAERP